MKNLILSVGMIVLMAVSSDLFAQNVSINATGSNPDTSAMLDVSSTTSGVLLPRMTTTQRDVIVLPATGLTIFNTSLVAYQFNSGTPTVPVWSTLNSGSGNWSILGNTGTNSGINYLGTSDLKSLRFRTNNVSRMIIDSVGKVGIGMTNPSDLLQVNGNASFGDVSTGTIKLTTSDDPTNTDIYTNVDKPLRITNAGTGSYGASLQLKNSSQNFLFSFEGHGGFRYYSRTLNGETFKVDDTGEMHSSGTGNNSFLGSVGIGTLTPATKLHIVGANPLTLMGVATGTNTTADSLLTITNGLVRKLPLSTFALPSNAWATTGNTGTNSGINYLGTADNTSLRFKTNGTLGMTLDSNQNVGIGTATPTAALNVVKNNPGGGLMVLQNANAAGYSSADFLTNTGVLAGTFGYGNTSANGPFAGKAYFNSYANDFTLVNGSTSMMYLKASNNFVGIGTTAPAYKLEVLGTNPLSLLGVQLGTNTTADSLLTITSGLVRKLPLSTFALSSNAWATTGNAGITPVINFLGTTDSKSLRFRTNNIQRMKIDSATGNVAIGQDIFDAVNPEKLVVNAGATTSVNALVVKGSIDNYLQFNVKNQSSGASATSDIVATADNGTESSNYVDLGINGSNYSGSAIQTGVANDAYLISAANDFYVVNSSTNKNMLFLTGGTGLANERMRILANGRVGMGVQNPTAPFVVKDTVEIRRIGPLSQLLFTNTAGSGDFRIGGDGGDIFWQGGGGRGLQMGSYWGTVLTGDRQNSAYPAFINAPSGTGVLVLGQRDPSVPLGIQAFSATQSGNLTEWRNSAGATLSAIDNSGNLGLGTTTPSTKLQVIGTNPVSLLGVQLGTNTSTDSVLTISGGIVQKLPASTFASATAAISSLNGLTATTQTFATGTTGADFNIASAASTHIFNLPDASATARGVITIGAQTIAGNKTLSGNTSIGGTLGVAGNSTFTGTVTASTLAGGASTDSIVTVNASTGLLNKRKLADIVNASAWSTTGNSATSASTNFIGTTDATDFVAKTNNTERIRITSGGLVGFNSPTPSYRLQLEDPGGPDADIATRLYNTNNLLYAPSMQLQASGGTRAAPTAVVANTLLGGVHFAGYDGASWNDIRSVSVQARTSQNWTTSAHGSYMNFYTVPNGSTLSAERMRIDPSGNVSINTSTFNAASPEKLLVENGASGNNNYQNVIVGKGNTNSYAQLNIQNNNAGAGASSDVVATADNGNETVNYIDMGMNSSANTSTGVIGGANTAYLYGTGNDFAIGNATTAKSLLFFTGGTGTNERMRIDGNGNVGIGTAAPFSALHIVKSSPNTNVLSLQNTSASGYSSADFFSNTGAQSGTFGFGNAGASFYSGRDYIALYGNDFIMSPDGTTAALFVKGNIGNVGINNTAPSEKLDVTGNVKFSGALMPNNLPGAVGNVLTSNGAGSAPTWSTAITGTNTGDVTIGTANGLSLAGQALSLGLSSTSTTGALSSTDWNTFNNKANTSNVWSLTGNAGTSASTNFLGTTDATDVVFKTNGVERMRIVNGVSASTGTAGDITIGDANSGTVRSNKEFVMREDGDQFGPSVLRLRNRSNENGAIFETIGASAALVDFLFKTGPVATPLVSNIRFETRAVGTGMFITGNSTEWQIGQPANPTFVVSAASTGNSALRIGNFGIGNVNPTEKLDVTGNIKFSGALMPNNLPGAVGNVLTSQGANTAPTWTTPVNQSISFAPTGDVTGTISGTNSLTPVLSIGANKVINTMLAQMPTLTIKGNNTGGTANATDLSVAQVNAILPVFSALKGLVPGTVSSTTNFLRADGTWAAPASSGWTTTGNSGTNSSTNFIGTIDNNNFLVKTNSLQAMIVDNNQNVAIGNTSTFSTTNPEQLLVTDAATGNSNFQNVIVGKGNTNSYAQLNIQNTNAGNTASSDVVATADNGNESVNYVDLGINSSSNTSTGAIGGANTAYLFSTGNDFAIGNGTSGKNLLFFTGGTGNNERMRVDGNGNVGIGTTAPTQKLDVNGAIVSSATTYPNYAYNSANKILFGENNPPPAETGSVVQFGSGSNTRNMVIAFGKTGVNSSFLGNDGNQTMLGSEGTANPITFRTGLVYSAANTIASGTEAMRITGTGNVGIGTTAPGQKLDVTGSINASGDIISQGNVWVDRAQANTGTSSPALRFGNSNTGETIASNRSAGNNQNGIDFYTSFNNRLSITNAGNVGIGTSAPGSKLTVAGDVSPNVDGANSLGTSTKRWTTAWLSSGVINNSDIRLKTNIKNLNYGLKEVLALQPVSYNWKKTPNTDKQVGLIAQDVRKLVPEVVVGDETKEMLGMKYTELIPVLINAIKEQQQQINDLKKDIELLKNKK